LIDLFVAVGSVDIGDNTISTKDHIDKSIFEGKMNVFEKLSQISPFHLGDPLMFIEFSVANYRSFRDQVTFSMVASAISSKNSDLDTNNVFAVTEKLNLLTSAAIYGANASGKSNLISAISFMRRFVMFAQRSTEATGGIDVEPFLLSTETANAPSLFEVTFALQDNRYRYGFEVTNERVEAEWLYVVANKPYAKESLLFEREGDQTKLGEKFSEGRDIIEKTRPNALFLSVVAQFNGVIAQKVISWFRNCNIISGLSDTALLSFTMRQLSNDTSSEPIKALMRRLDLGFEDLDVDIQSSIPEPDLPVLAGNNRIVDRPIVIVQTQHKVYDDEGHPVHVQQFDMRRNESEGTRKLFALSGRLLDTLQNGKVLLIDEMDARLHPLLTKEIVKFFNDPAANPRHAQLIFVTHDTNLLDNTLLRRDQIWFVEKDDKGGSQLYSLVEFKIDNRGVRNDASFEKDYIQGRYGAIPFLGDLRQLIAEDV
jgi:uncharacterized protein